MIRRAINFREKRCRLLIFLLFLFPAIISPADDNNKIIASVGDYKIFLTDFTERYSAFISSSGIKDNIAARLSILNNMITEVLLKNYDDNSNIYNNSEYLKELSWTRNQTILDYLKDQEIYAKLTASEEEIKEAFFRSNKQVAARHLFTQSEEEANHLYELLKIGVDFENLAAQVFTDSILRNNGGFLGYFSWGEMDPAFEDAAFSLRIGEISPPVRTAQGFSIIRVDDIIANPIITEYQFLQKKSQIERAVKINKKEPAERNYILNLVNMNEIKFNDGMLSKILDVMNGFQSDSETFTAGESECAVYNDIVYNYSYVQNNINELTEDYLQIINSVEDLKAVITGFIIRDKLLEIAYQKGYDKNERVIKTISNIHNNIFFRYKKDEIFNKAIVEDNEVLDFYYTNIYMFTREPEINVKEIIVKDKSLAENIFLELSSGKNFDELAKKFSIREWSAKRGGEIGFSPLSKYGMLKDRLWNAPIGELMEPVEIEGYYGIFKVIGKVDGKPVDFNLVKDEAARLLKEEKGKEIMLNYISEIKNKVKVEINNDLLWNHGIVYSSEMSKN
jgi:parvulin-like peptidyl-prolyl isomerase